MKLVPVFVLALTLASCGYSQIGSEGIGQVKRIQTKTPLICNNHVVADISLGVMIHGVGSMSTEDTWMLIQRDSDLAVLKQASESGKLVKVTYDVRRFAFCYPIERITKAELLENQE